MSTSTFPYEPGQVFKHKYGGFYRYLESTCTSDGVCISIIYEHVWPFEPSVQERSFEEFMEKFVPANQSDLTMSMARGRYVVQTEILQKKREK